MPPPSIDSVLDVKPVRARWLDGWVVFGAFTVPFFGSLYLLTVPQGMWPAIASAQGVLTLVFAAVELRLRRAGVRLTPEWIEERAYLTSAVFTPAERVASVLVLTVLKGSSDGTTHQLFLVDREGRTLLRMRGQLWDPRDLRAVSAYYAVPINAQEDAMTWSELRLSRYSRNLERWERHPYLVSTIASAAMAVAMTPPIAALTELVSEHG